ncbi:MAG: translation initiation factor IF-2 [Ruminococcaceae bacterium]|nr:translation initiation factor IF-2 [Oscillospiraceae bacterium]
MEKGEKRMSMMVKYKLSEVAKDFGLQNKEIADILKQVLDVSRSNSRALDEQELNVIFETLTQNRQVEDFAAVFKAMDEQKQAEKAAAEAAKKAEQEAAEAARRAEQEKKEAEEKKRQEAARKNDGGKKPEQPRQGEKKPEPQKNQTQQPQQQSQKGPKVRYVDTRGSSVNLEKYDERLDTLAPEDTDKMQSKAGKQKIKQNQQKRSQYGGSKRRAEEQEKMRRLQQQAQAKKVPLKVQIPDEITVGELALRLKKTAAAVIKELMKEGVMATVNQTVDFDTASLVAMELGAVVEKEVVVTIEERLFDESADKEEDLVERAPVVVVMGHVDHGKTSLLDAIRNTNVVSGEAGGITQHIGAYRVSIDGKEITFLDTPGHAAFTSMRARGAQVTDIAILVVAADDGIMPQTIEAINHAKAANVPIIVAVNKMDKPGANPDRVMQQLTEYELVPEEWGGSTIVCKISALKGEGIDNLLEMVLLTAEMQELRANPNRLAKGTVIEAKLDKGRGPVATVLVQNGTLKSSDIVIAGTAVGRIRAMVDDKHRKVTSAGPSVPVEIVGLAEVPAAGDVFYAVEDERMARTLAEQRREEEKEQRANQMQKVTLENLFSQIEQGSVKTLNIIVKADVQGSAEAVKASLEKISNEEVQVKVIHSAVGGINESDVMLAAASGAIIVGFNVRPDANAIMNAARDHVDIRLYSIIYNCIEEIEQAMKGMLAPKFREAIIGHAEIRQTFKVSGVGTIAGAYVLDGKMQRNEKVRIVRDNIVIHEGNLATLKRFKDDVREVLQGFECGMSFERYNDIKEGDVVEAFVMEQINQ